MGKSKKGGKEGETRKNWTVKCNNGRCPQAVNLVCAPYALCNEGIHSAHALTKTPTNIQYKLQTIH